MRVLTVRQPWASLIVAGHKDVENRTWATTYRGRVLIHAASRLDPTGPATDLPTPLGVVLGSVEIVDCVRNAASPWACPDCWHWMLARAEAWRYPVPHRGGLGLRHAPDFLVALADARDQ